MELLELELQLVDVGEARVLVAVQLHSHRLAVDQGDVDGGGDDAVPHVALPLKHVQPAGGAGPGGGGAGGGHEGKEGSGKKAGASSQQPKCKTDGTKPSHATSCSRPPRPPPPPPPRPINSPLKGQLGDQGDVLRAARLVAQQHLLYLQLGQLLHNGCVGQLVWAQEQLVGVGRRDCSSSCLPWGARADAAACCSSYCCCCCCCSDCLRRCRRRCGCASTSSCLRPGINALCCDSRCCRCCSDGLGRLHSVRGLCDGLLHCGAVLGCGGPLQGGEEEKARQGRVGCRALLA